MKTSQIYALGALMWSIMSAGLAAGGGTYIGLMFTAVVFFILATYTAANENGVVSPWRRDEVSDSN